MLQLIIMALLEIVLYTINEFIGRKILFAFDVGDTIFLHMFAAMFGPSTKYLKHLKVYLFHNIALSQVCV